MNLLGQKRMDQVLFLGFCIIWPMLVSGYFSYQLWIKPEKYNEDIQAFFGEDSWFAVWNTNRYVLMIARIVSLAIFLFLIILLMALGINALL